MFVLPFFNKRMCMYEMVFTYAALPAGRIKRCTRPSVRPSITCLRFSRNRKAIEASHLVQT